MRKKCKRIFSTSLEFKQQKILTFYTILKGILKNVLKNPSKIVSLTHLISNLTDKVAYINQLILYKG